MTEGRKPLAEHIDAHVQHCRHAGQSPHHVAQKAKHLADFAGGLNLTRLSELTAVALEGHLSQLSARRLSPRSVNFVRQIAVAFYSWCVKTRSAKVNPLKVVPKQEETRGRRRVR